MFPPPATHEQPAAAEPLRKELLVQNRRRRPDTGCDVNSENVISETQNCYERFWQVLEEDISPARRKDRPNAPLFPG
jgi:hypothetical protein